MTSKPVALILGSGPRVGASVAKKFASTGYSIAVTSRKATGGKTPEGYLSLKADLADPSSIPSVFDAVKAELKAAPSVVVYNGAAMTPPGDHLFAMPTASLVADMNINTISMYAAAQAAVQGWETLEAESKKVFIYTGNGLNTMIGSGVVMATLGAGKSASAYLIGTADPAYAKLGYRFFYADERYADGKVKGMQIDGDAHADFYAQLASGKGEVPWHATFVKDKGYVKF